MIFKIKGPVAGLYFLEITKDTCLLTAQNRCQNLISGSVQQVFIVMWETLWTRKSCFFNFFHHFGVFFRLIHFISVDTPFRHHFISLEDTTYLGGHPFRHHLSRWTPLRTPLHLGGHPFRHHFISVDTPSDTTYLGGHPFTITFCLKSVNFLAQNRQLFWLKIDNFLAENQQLF